VLAIGAEDVLAVPTAPSAVFDRSVDRGALEGIVARAQQLTAYLLTAAAEEGWRTRALEAVSGDKPLVGELPGLLVELVRCARRTDGSRECRVLERVLQHVLQDADKAEADLWMVFARKIEKSGEVLFSFPVIIVLTRRSSRDVHRHRVGCQRLDAGAATSRALSE
jgi:hypothetical protein